MSAHRALAVAEREAVCGGRREHSCHRCGRTASGTFPVSWDHLKLDGERWSPVCGRCVEETGHGGEQ